MEIFLRNPRYVGLKFPDMSRPESIEKRYLGKLSKRAMNFMKSVLVLDESQRLTAEDCVTHNYFEGLVSPSGVTAEEVAAQATRNRPLHASPRQAAHTGRQPSGSSGPQVAPQYQQPTPTRGKYADNGPQQSEGRRGPRIGQKAGPKRRSNAAGSGTTMGGSGGGDGGGAHASRVDDHSPYQQRYNTKQYQQVQSYQNRSSKPLGAVGGAGTNQSKSRGSRGRQHGHNQNHQPDEEAAYRHRKSTGSRGGPPKGPNYRDHAPPDHLPSIGSRDGNRLQSRGEFTTLTQYNRSPVGQTPEADFIASRGDNVGGLQHLNTVDPFEVRFDVTA